MMSEMSAATRRTMRAGSPRSLTRHCVLAILVVVSTSAPASAQIPIFDAATTARNRATAVLKELLTRIQEQQHDKLLEMARRLSTLTNLRKYRLDEIPRWSIHRSGNFLYASEYLEALTSGDPIGAAYSRLIAAVEQSPQVANLPPAVRRFVVSRLASVDLADATATAAIHSSGQARLDGRMSELRAIDALEQDVIDPAQGQSATAVLDKISGAALEGARQRQARIQLLTQMLEQLLVENKQMRDVEASTLNMQLTRWRDGRAADEAFVAGSADALRTWRQP